MIDTSSPTTNDTLVLFESRFWNIIDKIQELDIPIRRVDLSTYHNYVRDDLIEIMNFIDRINDRGWIYYFGVREIFSIENIQDFGKISSDKSPRRIPINIRFKETDILRIPGKSDVGFYLSDIWEVTSDNWREYWSSEDIQRLMGGGELHLEFGIYRFDI